MSVHATLLMGWSGTVGFLAVWFALLSRVRPDDGAAPVFASWAATNAFALSATAAVLLASDPASAARDRSLQLTAFGLAALLLPGLTREVTGREVASAAARSTAWVFSVAAAGGLLVDPDVADGRSLTRLGAALSVVLAVAAAPAVLALGRAMIEDRGLWPVSAAIAVGLVGGLVDVHRLLSGRRALEMASHAIGVATIAMGAALMRRLVQSEAELERSARALASSLDALRATETALREARSRAAFGELAAVIAHEVRNPLAILRNAAASLRKPSTSSVDIETLIEIVGEETRRLEQLGRSLAHFAEPMPFRPEPVPLRALLEDVCAAVRRAHNGAPGIVFRIAPTDVVAMADPPLLRQALVNVLDNAVRATTTGGTVEVVVRTFDDGRIHVAVRDDGEGMSEAVLARARDPFFTTRATGTGLGLALVDKVVRLHGGELLLKRLEPRGTEVTLVLSERAEPRQNRAWSGTSADGADGTSLGADEFAKSIGR